MTKKKLLFVDDEAPLCQLIKLNLERTGAYEVTTATSGQEGLEQARANDFDLVITDLRMPGMDGEVFLNALHALRPDTPVILCSVYHDDPKAITPEICRNVDGLVGKPIDRAQLCQAIKEGLARHSQRNTSP